MAWTRTRSFRRSLITNLLVIMLVFGVIMAGVTYAAVRFSARRASEAMMTQVVDGLATENAGFYNSIESIFTLVEIWAHRTWNGSWDTYEFDKTFPPMLLAFNQAASVYLALGSGDFYMLTREDGSWISWTVRPVAWGDRALVRTWSDAAPVPEEKWTPLKFDITQLTWFQGALDRLRETGDDAPLARRVFTSPPAFAPATGIPGRALSMATRSPLGDAFVFCFERSLVGVTEELQDLRVLDDGLVALLYGVTPATMVLTGVPRLSKEADLAAAEALLLQPPSRLGGPIADFVAKVVRPGQYQQGAPIRFDSAGSAWWGMFKRADARLFDLPSDPSWIVAAVPERDLLRRLPNMTLAILGATALAILLAMIRARALASSYSRPIDQLVDHSRRMQRLDFEHPATVDTNIIEIGILGGTLEAMRRALRSYASISEETRIAEAILRGTLPADLPRPKGYAIEALWRPAEETGGEVFDVVTRVGGASEGAAMLLLAPESFGVEAAVLSAQLRAVFRAAVRDQASPVGAAAQLQSCLQDDLRDAGVVRAWISFLDAAQGSVIWVAAGFGANLVHFRAATSDAVAVPGSLQPALGAAPSHAFQSSRLQLQPGDILAVASNGVIDALDKERQRFGLGRLQQLLTQHATADPPTLAQAIELAVSAFTQGSRVPADRTVLLLKRL